MWDCYLKHIHTHANMFSLEFFCPVKYACKLILTKSCCWYLKTLKLKSLAPCLSALWSSGLSKTSPVFQAESAECRLWKCMFPTCLWSSRCWLASLASAESVCLWGCESRSCGGSRACRGLTLSHYGSSLPVWGWAGTASLCPSVFGLNLDCPPQKSTKKCLIHSQEGQF